MVSYQELYKKVIDMYVVDNMTTTAIAMALDIDREDVLDIIQKDYGEEQVG